MRTSSQRLWTPAYILLSFVNLFAWMSYNLITPILAEYSLSIGTTLSLAGVIAGLFAMSSLFSRPVSGMLSDAFNRKRLNALFTAVMAISLLAYALVDTVWVLLVFRTLHGVAFGISSTASLAIVSDVVPESRLGEAVNYYGLAQIISAAIGPGLGIWLANAFNYRVCLLFGAVLLAVAAVAAVRMPYTPPEYQVAEHNMPKSTDFFEKRVWTLSMLYCSYTIVNGVVSTYLVALANERGIAGVNWHFTVNAVVLFLTRIVNGKQRRERSLSGKLYLSGACFAAAMLLIGGARSVWALLLSGAIKAVGQGIGMPAIQIAALTTAPLSRRGVAGSTIYIGGDLGQTIGAVAGGYTAQRVGYGTTHVLSIIPLALAAAVFALHNHRNRPKPKWEKEVSL